jgi:hypothetical protein
MAVTTITKVGAFSNDIASQINDNFTAVGTSGTFTSPTITSPTITGTTSIGAGATLTTPVLAGGTITGATLASSVNSDYKVLVAQADYSATVTPALITGFSWTVVPGTYVFNVTLPAVMTTNGGLTVSFVLTTAVLTSIQYKSYAATASDNTTAVSTTGTTATSTTKVFDSRTAAYTYVNIWGSMVVGTGGTFQWDACQNTSAGAGDASAIQIGAVAQMTRVV